MANEEHVRILKQEVEAWNKWRKENLEVMPDLEGADLKNAYLSYANLRGANLRGADFSGANLRGANLEGADLRDADLDGANLESADLKAADLVDATLNGAYLTSANLTYANCQRVLLFGGVSLWGANLMGAKLRDSDLRGATLGFTGVSDVNLSEAVGIEVVRHVRESPVSTSTLELTAQGLAKNPSRQGAVETFLRGAGVAEHMIRYFRSMIGKPIEFYSCFISYSHADKAFARRMYDSLQGKGIRCWLDEHQVLPGDHIFDAIDRGIKIWDKVLLCCSEVSLNSVWVDREIEKAVKKEERLWNERKKRVLAIIPLNLDGYLFSGEWKSSYVELVQGRLAAEFTGWESDNARFEAEFERVVKALRADTGAREPDPDSKL